MDDMASKNISSCTVSCPTQLFEWKLMCKFNTVLATKLPTDFNSTFQEVEILTDNELWFHFLVKQNQFYREARPTCPWHRPTEDICIGMFVFKRAFNVWHNHVEESMSINQHFEQFVGKQRLEGKYLGISEAEPLRLGCVNQFPPKGQCRTQLSLIYEF